MVSEKARNLGLGGAPCIARGFEWRSGWAQGTAAEKRGRKEGVINIQQLNSLFSKACRQNEASGVCGAQLRFDAREVRGMVNGMVARRVNKKIAFGLQASGRIPIKPGRQSNSAPPLPARGTLAAFPGRCAFSTRRI